MLTLAHTLSNGPPLVIDRATVLASGCGDGERGDRRALKLGLQRALASSPLDGLGLGPGEYLLITRLAVEERVEAGGLNRDFARSFSQRLRDCLDKAELDPTGPVAGGRPLRFSSLPRLAAWLIGEPRASAPYVSGLIADEPGAKTARDWIAHTVLPDAPATAQMVRILLEREKLGQWLVTLPPRDLAVLETGLERHFGVVLRGESEASESVAAQRSPRRKSQHKAPQLPALQTRLQREFAQLALPPRAGRIAAAFAYVSAFPSADRGAELRRFIAHVVKASPAAALPEPSASAPQGLDLPEYQTDSGEAASPRKDCGADSSDRSALDEASLHHRAKPDHTASAQVKQEQDTPASIALHGRQAAQPEPALKPLSAEDLSFSSPYCGLLFLTNLLRHLGFVADFGREQHTLASLAPFELIDAVGEVWFGAEYRSSPFHRWLANEAARRWVPQDFSHPLLANDRPEDDSCSVVRDGSRLTVWHRGGFPLLDRPARAESRRVAALVCSLGRASFSKPRALRPSPQQKLPRHGRRRWMGALALCLAHEMERRGGKGELTPDDLRLHGRIRIADGQITVHFDLADLPFAARAAGLDRDPGWIQEEGRSIAFIYI